MREHPTSGGIAVFAEECARGTGADLVTLLFRTIRAIKKGDSVIGSGSAIVQEKDKLEEDMVARFQDTFISREHRFSLGIGHRTDRRYLSTPVSGVNRAVEWEAYFTITEGRFQDFQANPASTDAFTEDCRMGRNEHLLIHPS